MDGILLDAEAHYYSPPPPRPKSLSKGDGIWGSPAHMRISLSLLLLGRYASPVISCKTGHAHLLLQNYFLLKMLFHDQGTYWSLWWPSFSASELDPAEGHTFYGQGSEWWESPLSPGRCVGPFCRRHGDSLSFADVIHTHTADNLVCLNTARKNMTS